MLLLEKGADPLIQDSEGRSARDFASASDCVWPHYAVHGCQRMSKQDLIDRGIIKKVRLVETSRPVPVFQIHFPTTSVVAWSVVSLCVVPKHASYVRSQSCSLALSFVHMQCVC